MVWENVASLQGVHFFIKTLVVGTESLAWCHSVQNCCSSSVTLLHEQNVSLGYAKFH
jgi:hypothetical protein